MRLLPLYRFALLSAGLATSLPAAVEMSAEAGASYFQFNGTHYEGTAPPFETNEPREWAPYLAVTAGFSSHVGLRLAYHYLSDVETTIGYGSPPGSLLPVVVYGHYRDDVHLLSLSPEFSWRTGNKLSFAVAPLLNWVASRGTVAYSTNNALIQLVGPRDRTEEGFTWGGAARVAWSLGSRWGLTASYQYVDLEPSFGRKASVFSGGLRWRF